MNEKLKEKVKESLSSVLPITLIVLVLSITLVPMEIGTLALFLTGAVLLIFGMGFFQLGAEMSMTPLGEGVGKTLAKREKVILVVLVSFALGTIITIAEPDLQVLANQVASIPNNVLIWTVAVGVGVFLALAVLRIFYRASLAKCLLIAYALLFALTLFSPKDFLAVAFDAGGVTTGPITVPFIMALGVGVSALRTAQGHDDDSFGLVALCSVGPILMVLLLGIFYHPSDAIYSAVEIAPVVTTRDVAQQFAIGLPDYAKEVLLSILPIVAVCVLFQLLTHHYRRRQLLRTGVGFLYTVIGLILFLTGVNIGFTPVGNLLGSGLADSTYRWVLIPIGALIGYYIVKAEPAVQVLNKQVEDVTGGTVSVDLSREYEQLVGVERTIADYCITLSLMQLDGIYAVRLTVNGLLPEGRTNGVYTSAEVLLTSPEDIVRTVKVTLYFPTGSGTLTGEERRLTVYEGETVAQAVVKALAERPMDSYAGSEQLLPEGFAVLDTKVEGGTCYLNLAGSVTALLPEDNAEQEQMIQGLVDSLCSLEDVSQVQLMVDGEYQMMLGCVPISRPLLPTGGQTEA